MKQTAIEWLESQLFELRNPTLTQIEIIDQAKEMEKKQIMEAWLITKPTTFNGFSLSEFEQYYNEIFNGQNT